MQLNTSFLSQTCRFDAMAKVEESSPISHCLQERFKLDKDEAQSGGGRFRAIIDTVIGNLQLSVTNIHVRYEVSPQEVMSITPPVQLSSLNLYRSDPDFRDNAGPHLVYSSLSWVLTRD